MPDPRFPTFDIWQSMTESEQDSLIAKLERRKRRRERLSWFVMATLLLVAMGGALYMSSIAQG